MQDPTERTLRITKINPRATTPRGNHYLACETDAGIVAFWGSDKNLRNIELIEKLPRPVEVTCGCIRPGSDWEHDHVLWVPEGCTIKRR